MKVEKFLEIFPEGGITFTRAERGEHNKRRDGWIVYFSNCYWTSDSDRLTDHVTNHTDRDNEAFAFELEDALDLFCQQLIAKAKSRVISAQEHLEECKANVQKQIERITTPPIILGRTIHGELIIKGHRWAPYQDRSQWFEVVSEIKPGKEWSVIDEKGNSGIADLDSFQGRKRIWT